MLTCLSQAIPSKFQAPLISDTLESHYSWLAWNSDTIESTPPQANATRLGIKPPQTNATRSATKVSPYVLHDPAYTALESVDLDLNALDRVGKDYADRFSLHADEVAAIRHWTNVGDVGASSLLSGLRKLPTYAGTSFRCTAMSAQTLRLLNTKEWLTISDLTMNGCILAASLGGYSDMHTDKRARMVIQADSDKDGPTWIAPLSEFGLRENEVVFYGGSFRLQKMSVDSNSEITTIYLQHRAVSIRPGSVRTSVQNQAA